ncbi:MAG TPA: F0F1 ATP synthase subunit delta [Candidatus Moranbacteria bacterium]|nr:F0F1 ATP synthase subunit delta [Candidatus Moranbacteria bacterium]
MRISPKQYARLIFEMADDLSEPAFLVAFKKVAKVIFKNRDERKIEKIADELVSLIKKKKGLAEVKITTAEPLEEESLSALRNILAQRNNLNLENLKLETIVDKKIKSGLIIQVNNEIWDNSLRSKLQRMKASLAS